MRKLTLSTGTRSNTAMFGIAALILLAIGAFSYRESRQYHQANAEATLSREIVGSVDALLSNLVDAEAGQRGFLLTGDNRYLDPYNRAVQAIPHDLTDLKSLLAARPGEQAKVAPLDSLVDEKLAELRDSIERRRTQSAQAAVALVLSDQDLHTMRQIRALCTEIKRDEGSAQSNASAEGEAAAQTALLATVAGSLVLLFLFAFGLEPFASPDPQANRRSWPLRYGVAVLAVVATVLFRAALTPLMGPTAMPFTLFFPAVWFAAWFGGLRPGLLSLALAAPAGAYFFAAPVGSLRISGPDDRVAMLMLVLVGFGMALLSRSQQQAVERAKRAEDAEGKQRQRFETTLASIGDAVISTDAEGRVAFANKIAQSLLRCAGTEVIGKHLDEVFRIVNEFSRAKAESPVVRVLREGTIVGLGNHTLLLAQDGTEIPIDDSAAPILGEGGAIQGTVLVFRDITERRRLEGDLRKLAAIVESSDDAMISKTLDCRIASWNRGAERMYGYAKDEVIGRPVTILAPPGREHEMPTLMERIQQGETVSEFQTQRRRKDGTIIDVSLTVSPVHGENGNVMGAAVVGRDITAHVQIEKERSQLLAAERDARERAEAAVRAKDEFVAMVSHEVRTPLNAILGWAQILRTGKLDQAETARALEAIERNAQTQAQLIGDLLDVSGVITGRVRLDVRSVELKHVVEAAIDAVQPAADAKSIQLNVHLERGQSLVSGDPSRLQQVVSNLLSNAVKFTPRYGHITLRLDRIDSQVQLTVSDSGMGITREFLPYVFDRFSQANKTSERRLGGLGLGLTIVRHLVELHGGTVRADSPGEGKGATFTVTLPITAVRGEAGVTSATPLAAAVRAPFSGTLMLDGLRLLIVDDEADARDLLVAMLGRQGAEVKACGSAAEALRAIEQWRPSLLVSDIGMPDEDGYELVRRLRALDPERGGAIPAVALTAYARGTDRMRVLAAGFQQHIAKPVEAVELITVIASLAGRTGHTRPAPRVPAIVAPPDRGVDPKFAPGDPKQDPKKSGL